MKIPRDRIAVFIGTGGEVKRELEELTGSKINVDSKEGEIEITGSDPLKLFTLQSVIKAIGRGFNPDVAFTLLKQDYTFELVPIKEFAKGKNAIERLRGRIIGKKGKSRSTLEILSDCRISVYGNTVGVIGRPEKIMMVRKAIEALLRGAPHSNVYKSLEGKIRDIKPDDQISFKR